MMAGETAPWRGGNKNRLTQAFCSASKKRNSDGTHRVPRFPFPPDQFFKFSPPEVFHGKLRVQRDVDYSLQLDFKKAIAYLKFSKPSFTARIRFFRRFNVAKQFKLRAFSYLFGNSHH
jgi:hypothetical protein